MKYLVLSSLLALAGCLDHRDATADTSNPGWRYEPSAPHYEHVSPELRQAVAVNPSGLASRICADMAGELEFMQSSERDRASFTCRFEEAGHAFSLDFGALVRN